jgi:glycosyltransferase involved in cell wall biosynthesis
MPQVSVVIPAYKSRQFIAEAVDSVLAQTFKDFDVVVVDDGCPEGTGRFVAERYTSGQVRVLFQENRGPGAARNAGILGSSGAWVAFLDADDAWMPEKLEQQLALAAAHPEYGLISSSYYKSEGGKFFERRRRGKSGWVYPEVFMKNYIRTSTVMIRRDCFDRVGLFDASLPLTQDYDLWLRMARAYPVGYVNRALATYRHHPGGISRKVLKSREYFLKILERNYDPEKVSRRRYRKRLAYVHYHIAKHCRGPDLASRRREHLREAIRLQPLNPLYRLALLRPKN